MSYFTVSPRWECIQEAIYRYLPLQYDLKLANSDGTYSNKNYDITETTSYLAGKIYFNTKIAGLLPVVAISTQSVKIKDNIQGDTKSKSTSRIWFGLNSRF